MILSCCKLVLLISQSLRCWEHYVEPHGAGYLHIVCSLTERSLNNPLMYQLWDGRPPQVWIGAFNPPNYEIPGKLPP
jgi:hypothetical protein